MNPKPQKRNRKQMQWPEDKNCQVNLRKYAPYTKF